MKYKTNNFFSKYYKSFKYEFLDLMSHLDPKNKIVNEIKSNDPESQNDIADQSKSNDPETRKDNKNNADQIESNDPKSQKDTVDQSKSNNKDQEQMNDLLSKIID